MHFLGSTITFIVVDAYNLCIFLRNESASAPMIWIAFLDLTFFLEKGPAFSRIPADCYIAKEQLNSKVLLKR